MDCNYVFELTLFIWSFGFNLILGLRLNREHYATTGNIELVGILDKVGKTKDLTFIFNISEHKFVALALRFY